MFVEAVNEHFMDILITHKKFLNIILLAATSMLLSIHLAAVCTAGCSGGLYPFVILKFAQISKHNDANLKNSI